MPSHAPPSLLSSPLFLELARRLGVEPVTGAVAEPGPDTAAWCEISDPTVLFGADHGPFRARLEELVRSDPTAAGTSWRNAACEAAIALLGRDRTVQLCRGAEAARELAVAIARRSTGREVVLSLGDEDADAVIRRIEPAGDSLAALVFEPYATAADADRLRALCETARGSGAVLIADETRTACRLAAGTVTAALGIDADLVAVGEALACGRPFGAVLIAPRLVSDAGPCGSDQPDAPDDLTLAVAVATMRALGDEPIDGRIAAIGRALCDTLRTACAREQIDARVSGPEAAPRLAFAGQENAEAPLIAHHFQLELGKLGVHADARLYPNLTMEGAPLLRICAAFDGASARMRTLLIEHNSYLCGGVPWVFPGGADLLRARGIARYRYPARAEVDVEPVGEAVRISFAAGELSEITSSGFYVPTRIRGDFDVSVRYAVRRWSPGPDSACLALFVQNEESTARYYAQRMSGGDAPDRHTVLAVLQTVQSGRRPVTGMAGELRLRREGERLSAWHRSSAGEDFELLGEDPAATTDDVIVGAKIWSKVRCGGLEADLSELCIDAEVPAEQLPVLEERPDPRDPRRPGSAPPPT